MLKQANMTIPDYYLPVMPYLILNDAAGFLKFAKTVFGAKEQMIVPGTDARQIMHGEITIGKAAIMFADASEQWQEKTSGMFLYVSNLDAIFSKAIDNGAVALSAPQMQQYGYSAGFNDPFGNQWWITDVQE